MYNDIFLKMDIKDFFPSINHKKLAECLYFEINKKTSISRKECYDIVRKCSVSDGTLWEGQTALYFRWTCLPDGAVPELAAGFSRNDRRLS